MPASIHSLNSFIPVTSILQACREGVKGAPHPNPIRIVCRFCEHKDHTMYIYEDPADPPGMPRGAWIYCTNCNWRGDGISFLQHLRKNTSENMTRFLSSLFSEHLINLPAHALTIENARRYISNYKLIRENPMALWDDARTRISKSVESEWIPPLNKMGIWGGQRSRNWTESMGNLIGITDRPTVQRLLGFVQGLPPDGWFYASIMPYFDLPGRIRSFLFSLPDGEQVRYMVPDFGSASKDAGILGMQLLEENEEVVYAVADTQIALRLFRKSYSTTNKPPKIISWDENTTGSWRNLSAKKIIFWSPNMDAAFFYHAKSLPTALVATNPALRTGNFVRFIDERTVQEMLHMMYKTAKPWEHVFKDWFLELHTNDAVLSLDTLKLTDGECAKVRALCTTREKKEFDDRLGILRATRSFEMWDHVIYEEPASWYALDKRGKSTQITSFRAYIKQTIDHIPSGKKYFDGRIVLGVTVELPFFAEIEAFSANPTKWLTNFLIEHEYPRPTVDHKWRSWLMDIIEKSSGTIPTVRSYGKVGLQPEHETFIFPSFSFTTGGEVRKGRSEVMVQPDNELPFREVYPSHYPATDDVLRSWTSSNVVCGSFLAMAAAVFANMIAPKFNQPFRPIGLVGQQQSASDMAGQLLVDAFRLRRFSSENLRWPVALPIRERLLQRVNEHVVPAYLDHQSAQLRLKHWAENLHSPIIARLNRQEALAAAASGDWIFIVAPREYATGFASLQYPSSIIRYLGWLQSVQWEIQPDDNFQMAVLTSIQRWIDTKVSPSLEGGYMYARRILRGPGVSDTTKYGTRALMLICDLVSEGSLLRSQEDLSLYNQQRPIDSTKQGVVEDIQKGQVFISRKKLLSVLDYRRLPAPNMVDLDRSFSEAGVSHQDIAGAIGGNGWVIDRTYYEGAAKEWREFET